MIIGIDASRANRREKTGIEWYSFYVICELAKLDKTNQYWLYTDQPLDGELADLVQRQDNFHEKILNWPIANFWTLGRLSLEMLIRKPDILFIPGHTLPFFAPAKTVITIHDVGFKRQTELYRGNSKKPLLNILARIFTFGRYGASEFDYLDWSSAYAVRHATKILTVSEFSKSEISRFYPARPNQIAVVHNGYDENTYGPVAASKLKAAAHKYHLEAPYLLYVGRLERKKNTGLLIRAFADFISQHPAEKIDLVLAGKLGYGGAELKELVDKLNLTKRVKFLGWVPEHDLPALYSGAEIFVFPSAYEGFGIPLLQAMACGTPIIAANSASLPEVAEDAASYFAADKTKDLTDKLNELVFNEELKEKLRIKGFARVKDFSWQNTAKYIKKELETM